MEVPRIVWGFWGGNRDGIVNTCFSSWEKNLEGWDVRILDGLSYTKYVNYDFDTRGLTSTKFSDLLRLTLLKEYGGVWMDATTFVNRNLDWIFEYFEDEEREVLCSEKRIPADKMGRFSWESNFIVARPKTRTITIFEETFRRTIRGERYMMHTIPFVKNLLLDPDYHLVYFVQYHLRIQDPLFDLQFSKPMLSSTFNTKPWDYGEEMIRIIRALMLYYQGESVTDDVSKGIEMIKEQFVLLKIEKEHRRKYHETYSE